MSLYYSSSSGGFYSSEIHGTNMPADCVEISPEKHAALLEQQSRGSRIVGDTDGSPTLASYPRADLIESITKAIKAERDRRMQTGGYSVADMWFHSDIMSRSQQASLLILGDQIGPDLQWRLMDGDYVLMTPELAKQIFAAQHTSDVAHFHAAEAHISALRSSDHPESYNFSSGWPPIFMGAAP